MSFSPATKKALLERAFLASPAAYTWPTTFYAALNTTTGVEVTTAGQDSTYARQALTMAWDATNLRVHNTAAVTYAAAALVGAAFPVVEVAIYDAATAGNLIATYALQFTKTVGASDVVSFAIDEIQINLV